MPDPAPLPKISNFREMGGLPSRLGTVRHGVLYRSGHLAAATDQDLEAIVALGITRIVDFRTQADFIGDGGPDRVPAGVSHIALEMTDSSGRNAELRGVLTGNDAAAIEERFGGGRAREIATKGVVTMAVDPDVRRIYGEFLRVTASAEQAPILWHCSAGKDRAGWAATLVGLALDVPDDALVAHYLESNEHQTYRVDMLSQRGFDVELITPFLFVHEDYIRAGLAAIDRRWDSRRDYLLDGLGLSQDEIDSLQANLVA